MQQESEQQIMSPKASFRNSFMIPAIFVSILWLLELLKVNIEISAQTFGIIPRNLQGLAGILTAPFIHAGIDHLLSNTLPLLVVGAGLFYFYPTLAWRVVILVWAFSGIWVWLAGRASAHIGASGLIYGFVCFLFFSGLLRKDTRLIAISLLVTFLYGSLVWGILPVDQSVSWESHLFGAIAGCLTALYYRKDGPQRPKAQWEIEEELENDNPENINEQELLSDVPDTEVAPQNDSSPLQIRYIYKEDGDEKQSDKGF